MVVVCGRVDLVAGMLFELFDVDLRPRKVAKSATRMPVNPLLGWFWGGFWEVNRRQTAPKYAQKVHGPPNGRSAVRFYTS